MKAKTTGVIIASTIVLSLGTIGCSNEEKKEVVTDAQTEIVEVDVMEVPVIETIWLIDEHQVSNTIPVTSAALLAIPAKSSTEIKEEETEEAEEIELDEEIVEGAEIAVIEEEEIVEEEIEEEEYEILASEDVHEALLAECAPVEEEVVVSSVILDETQSIKSFKKNGKEAGEIQVISTPDGVVEQIIFTGGKHQDVYDVQTGLTGKEVRKLRKEMKHVVKKGQVFLYSESSNVMYLMDDTVKSVDGKINEEITIDDVNEMNVQAIIWKDKKGHNK